MRETTFYYLVRSGTSLRATTLDKNAIMVEESAIDDALRFYENLVGLREVGPLVAIEVDDYHARFDGAKRRAKEAARRSETETEE